VTLGPPTPPQIASMLTLNEMHVRRNVVETGRLHHEVEMVRHQAVRVQLYGPPFASLAQQDEKRRVINRFGEDDFLVVAAIDDVQDAAWRHNPISSGHKLSPLPGA
jgi:hypothetical protein